MVLPKGACYKCICVRTHGSCAPPPTFPLQCLYSHPYPVGYKAYRNCWGMNFEMGIISEGGRPVFTVRSKDVRALHCRRSSRHSV
jgi:hypothetical protein